MGVVGLLPFVKKACYEGNLNEFKGKTLLVDVSCLLHRGVFGCAGKLAMGQDTELYIGYVQKYVKQLLMLDCHVILVFDGRALPAKKDINASRREFREKYQSLGTELLSQGLTAEAHRAFSKGVMLTREVIEKTIKTFNKIKNVDTIIAPYEADAQIAYLMKEGYAHAVVTEDSDLIVFGCDKIIFKMDPATGFCVVYEKQKLANCVCPVLRRRFDFVTFRRICILAGCDYLQGGLQGVGLRTAEEVFTKASCQTNLQSQLLHLFPLSNNATFWRAFTQQILTRLQLYTSKRLKVKVDAEFVDAFIRAENTFLYQVVFDPLRREQKPLNPYPESSAGEGKENCLHPIKKYNYAGEVISPRNALRLALGNDDLSKSSLEDEFVLPSETPAWSIWNNKFRKTLEKEKDQREKALDDKFGAFRPKKSPLKRPAADNKSTVATQEQSEKADVETVFMKRRRFSEIQIGNATQRNGIYVNWTARDWMRIYGQLTQKEEDDEENSSKSSGMSSQ